MLFFILLRKKLLSPPVKIILMFLNSSKYCLIIPFISETVPFITPEINELLVVSPTNLKLLVKLIKGKFAVKEFNDLNLIEIPGEIPPPKYSFLKFLKSYVMQEPASIINTLSFGNLKAAAETKANLSCPNVFLELYKFLKGNFS